MKRIVLIDEMSDNAEIYLQKIEKEFKCKRIHIDKLRILKVMLADVYPKWITYFLNKRLKSLLDTHTLLFPNAINNYIERLIAKHLEVTNGELNNTLFVIIGVKGYNDLKFFASLQYPMVSLSSHGNRTYDFDISDYDIYIEAGIIATLKAKGRSV